MCHTYIRFSPSVSAYMPFQATPLYKEGAARVTFIRFLTSVNANVKFINP